MGFSDKHGDDLGMVPLALCHRNHTVLKKCKHNSIYIYVMFLDYKKIFARVDTVTTRSINDRSPDAQCTAQ